MRQNTLGTCECFTNQLFSSQDCRSAFYCLPPDSDLLPDGNPDK